MVCKPALIQIVQKIFSKLRKDYLYSYSFRLEILPRTNNLIVGSDRKNCLNPTESHRNLTESRSTEIFSRIRPPVSVGITRESDRIRWEWLPPRMGDSRPSGNRCHRPDTLGHCSRQNCRRLHLCMQTIMINNGKNKQTNVRLQLLNQRF